MPTTTTPTTPTTPTNVSHQENVSQDELIKDLLNVYKSAENKLEDKVKAILEAKKTIRTLFNQYHMADWNLNTRKYRQILDLTSAIDFQESRVNKLLAEFQFKNLTDEASRQNGLHDEERKALKGQITNAVKLFKTNCFSLIKNNQFTTLFMNLDKFDHKNKPKITKPIIEAANSKLNELKSQYTTAFEAKDFNSCKTLLDSIESTDQFFIDAIQTLKQKEKIAEITNLLNTLELSERFENLTTDLFIDDKHQPEFDALMATYTAIKTCFEDTKKSNYVLALEKLVFPTARTNVSDEMRQKLATYQTTARTIQKLLGNTEKSELDIPETLAQITEQLNKIESEYVKNCFINAYKGRQDALAAHEPVIISKDEAKDVPQGNIGTIGWVLGSVTSFFQSSTNTKKDDAEVVTDANTTPLTPDSSAQSAEQGTVNDTDFSRLGH